MQLKLSCNNLLLQTFYKLFMSLSIQDVQRIAHLARIKISPAEAEATLTKLTGIMELIEQMQAIDTSGIDPMSHSQDVTQRLREDVVSETNNRAAFQAIAPQVQDGLYLVPKVIE
jgi:aspartyl-tRNA(Asn)/glutamyl-tRNA(Gln) amidotransferase subunit C